MSNADHGTHQIASSFDEMDGVWIAECVDLPGCVSQGDTAEAALENIRDAIDDVLALSAPYRRSGESVEVLDAFGEWMPATALTGVEGTRNAEGRKWHDFPVVWVTTNGKNRIPWPAKDIRRALDSDGTQA